MPEAAQHQIDTRAIEVASAALAQIQHHERACDERMETIRHGQDRLEKAITDGFNEVHKRINDTHVKMGESKDVSTSRFIRMAVGAIAALLTVTGVLFVRAVGWF